MTAPDAWTEEGLREMLTRVLPVGTLRDATLHGWHLTFVVSTERYRRVRFSDIASVVERLGVDADAVELWDVAGGVEFSVDLDPVTPIETPRGRP